MVTSCLRGHLPALKFCTAAAFILFLAVAGRGQTLTVTAVPSALTIYPGQQNVPVAVTVSAVDYSGPVTVTFTGLPSGVTVSPLTIAGGSTGTLNLSASISAGQEGFTDQGPSMTTAWTASASVVAAAGSLQASAPFPLSVSISNPAFQPAPSNLNLPILRIDTGGVPIVNKTTDVPGSITITSPDGQTSYLPSSANTDNTAVVHLHGNSTLGMPKLPYHVKFNTSLDLLGAMGLSCPYVTSKGKPVCDKSKSYILLANYDDKTFLRDWAASALANSIPIGNGYLGSTADSPSPSGNSTLMPWAPHSLFVELYLNGIYEGNYQLIEEIKVDSHRVNISELAETDVTDDITGGYLLEIDQHQDEAFVFTTIQGVNIGLIDPDFSPAPEIPTQTSYISSYVESAEDALFSGNFTDPALGWRAYFDEASAVNFYIVNDLMGNQDGGDFYSSTYFYKPQDNPLLYMGPIWDFDISAGNVNYSAIENPTFPWMQQQAVWYRQWFTDPGFAADVAAQWNALKSNGVLAAWMASIPAEAATLEQSQVNNQSRWPMQGIRVWPNAEAAGGYDAEVQYFTDWLQLRYGYLDSLFNSKSKATVTFGIGAGTLRSGVPVVLTAHVTGGASPAGNVTFLANNAVIGAAPISGGSATLTVNALRTGTYPLQAIYNGDQNNALSASNVHEVTVASPLASATVSLAASGTPEPGSSASFIASVIPNSGATTPTGTVSFTVDSGSATAVNIDGSGLSDYSVSLAGGAHTITAAYSGDQDYAAATASISINVVQTPVFTLSGTALTISPGATTGNSTPITIAPGGGFTGSVTLAASITSSPAGAQDLPTFSFGSTNPATVTASGNATATLTVVTTPATSSAAIPRGIPGNRFSLIAGSALACVLLFGIPARRRKGLSLLTLLCAFALLCGGAISCGTHSDSSTGSPQPSGTTPGSYTVTITGTSGSISAQTTVALVVQ
jgi:hypothetical protein